MAGVLSLELVQATDEVEITGERKNMRWTRELDTVLLRQILATGLDAFMTSRHNTKNKKYDQSKTWQSPGGIIPTLQQAEEFKGLKLPTYQSIINHVTCSPHGLLAKYSHLFTPGKEQAEPAPAGTEGTKDERPLGEFETLIIEVSELFHEAKKLEKEKDGVEADAAETTRRDEDMQSESVKRKYGGISEDELKGSRSNRKKARQARLSDSDSSGNMKKKIRITVADYCEKHQNASYSDIILGGSNVPKGYKLISPEDDEGFTEYYLEEESRASSAGEISSFRDKLSETMDKLNEERDHRLRLEDVREKNRQEELKLQQCEMALREAKEKRDAKRDKMMFQLFKKYVTKAAEDDSSDGHGDLD